ncbi:MAG: FMN-dependent NADH-azoreductase [Alphaproteobacteria bacterium]|nr:FMN-dependent NADH-azoreductase [Alphaproteobacteria bacterium]
MTKILHVQSSPNHESVSRKLAERLLERLKQKDASIEIITRCLSKSMPLMDEEAVFANRTPDETKTPRQKEVASFTDTLVDEVLTSNVLVISTPMHNFSIPAILKTWLDLIVQARRTFRYKPDGSGSEGLAGDRKTYIVIATGGAQIGSASDFISPYLKFILGFIGITSIEILGVSGTGLPNAAENIKRAEEQIDALAA